MELKNVRIGEILEVEVGKLHVHTILQEFLGDGEFLAPPPTIKGTPLRNEEEIFRFSFFRPEGMYVFEAEKKEEFERDGIKLCRYKLTSEITKIQRRQYYRLPIAIDVLMVNETDNRQYKCKTVTLSENSVHLRCYTLLALDTPVCVKIPVSARETIPMPGKIIKSMEPAINSDPFEMVVLFEENAKFRPRLARFVFTQQIIARNRRQK
ncbi:MAG: PilZ domain-containing protein [Burkholderiales bacterium]